MTPFVERYRNHWVSASATKKGITATANPDGTLTLAGASTGETSVFSVDITTLKPGETYTASVDEALSGSTQAYLSVRSYNDSTSTALASFGSGTLGLVKTFKVPADSIKCVCMLYSASAGEIREGTYHIMLNQGAEPLPWRAPGVPLPTVPGGDGFGVGVNHLSDFGQVIASRTIGVPEKKSITKTVPHMSGFYDFSKIYGAVAFENREITYRIEMIGDDREDLQEQKGALLAWVALIHDAEIYDDDIQGLHFVGSFDSADWEEEDDGESGALEVTFLCQPFIEANDDRTQTVQVGSGTVTIEGQPVSAYVKAESGTATIKVGAITQSVSTTETRLVQQLQTGDNAVTVSGAAVTIRWRELKL